MTVRVRCGPESKDMLATMGSFGALARAARNAISNSSISENVSSTIASTPPAARASACSAKFAVNSESLASWTRSILPLGPIEPTTHDRSLLLRLDANASTTSAAISAPRRAISRASALHF
jgi:hypothetical protein